MTRTAIVVTHGGRPEALVALREAMHELTAAGFTCTAVATAAPEPAAPEPAAPEPSAPERSASEP